MAAVIKGVSQEHKPAGPTSAPSGYPSGALQISTGVGSTAVWSEATKTLGRFDQLHSAVALAVKHLDATFQIAKDKYFAIAKLGFFDCFLQREGLE